ncbi:hypothetical protein CIK05_01260 [Bdellovibrio sp. qaytius]|nr:hypothetical protein CIK05_01260 [Bdellovibrio sp. qaytius]
MKTAVVIGATGLIGSELVQKLMNSSEYNKIIAIVRRPKEWPSQKVEVINIPFEQLEQQQFSDGADYFCALGTTIKQVGSQAEFRKVDYEYVLSFAKVAKKCSANSFHLVSALGASAKSANFYSRTKGQIENAVSNLEIKKVRIYRPSLLIGKREKLGQPSRLGEEIFTVVYNNAKFLFSGFMKKYEPITAEKVATAMFNKAVANTSLVKEIISNQDMH